MKIERGYLIIDGSPSMFCFLKKTDENGEIRVFRDDGGRGFPVNCEWFMQYEFVVLSTTDCCGVELGGGKQVTDQSGNFTLGEFIQRVVRGEAVSADANPDNYEFDDIIDEFEAEDGAELDEAIQTEADVTGKGQESHKGSFNDTASDSQTAPVES